MSTSQGSENNYPDSNQQNFNSPFITQNDKPTNFNTQGYGTNNLISTSDNQYNQNTPQSQNIVIQPIPQCEPNSDINNPFPNAKSINHIRHRGVSQIAENKFQIKQGGCCYRLCFPIFFMFIGLGLIVSGLGGDPSMIFGGVAFFFVGVGIMCCRNKTVIFTLGENSLMVETETCCSSSNTVYHPREIFKVEFSSYFDYDSENQKTYHSHLILFTKNGQISLINCDSSSKIFTDQEMDYLTYIVNNHIKKKMNVK